MTTSNSVPSTVIVYHSGYGHTQRMAQAVADGAGATLLAIDAEGNLSDDGWAALDTADAIIFGSPTYMGDLAGNLRNLLMHPQSRGFPRSGKTRSLAASPTAPASMAIS
nr:flavodoxin domain-containing protein [Rhizobium leguminosarum]